MSYVPKSRQVAPPGRYTAPITISSDQGRTQLMLELQVWDFALPEESHLKPNIHTDTEINTFPEAIELKYYQLLRKHRISMYPLGYAPALKISGTNLQIDWSKYDARLAKYLDGSAFTREYGYSGPGYGVPIEYLVLPFDAYPMNLYKQARGIQLSGKEFKFYAPWPVAMPRHGPTPEYREIWKNAFRAYQAHFDQHPAWNKTRLLVYFLSLDEAYDDVARERMLYFGQLLKESGAPRLQYRVDGWYPKETMERLKKVLNVVILGLGGWDSATVDEIKKQGVDPWFYTDASWIDGDGLKCRALSWIAWKLRAGSWTLWELDFNSLRAWQYPESYETQNGSGMLVYRGETMGLEGAGREYPSEGIAPRKPGLRVFLASFAGQRRQGNGGPGSERCTARFHRRESFFRGTGHVGARSPTSGTGCAANSARRSQRFEEFPRRYVDAMRSNDINRSVGINLLVFGG